MQVFSRTRAELAKSVAYSAMAGLAGWFVAVAINAGNWLLYLLPAVFVLGAAWLFLLGDNIKIELEPDGTMRCYKNNRLRHTFFLPNCEVSRPAPRKQRGLAPAIRTLTVSCDGGSTVKLDCECLGEAQFTLLCNTIQQIKQQEAGMPADGDTAPDDDTSPSVPLKGDDPADTPDAPGAIPDNTSPKKPAHPAEENRREDSTTEEDSVSSP